MVGNKYLTKTIEKDIEQIEYIGERNLIINSKDWNKTGGIATVFTPEELKRIISQEKSLSIKYEDQTVGYFLGCKFGEINNILGRENINLEKLIRNSKNPDTNIAIKNNDLYVIQACLEEDFRGKINYMELAKNYLDLIGKYHDKAITEILGKNRRSMLPHKRIGFQEYGTLSTNLKTFPEISLNTDNFDNENLELKVMYKLLN